MKYKLLAVSTENGINIGDYMQAVATAQFLPNVDGFVEREQLHDYDGEPCRVIMNGWFLHDPMQWPPSDKIDPLFASVHFNPSARWKLFDAAGIEYLRKHEPIGCSDLNTLDKLLKKGINATFSSSLTLTLGYKYHTTEKNGKVIFVDPFFVTNWTFRKAISNALYLFTHFRAIRIISKKHPDPKTGLRKMIILATFYREYRKFFTDKTLLRADYVGQQSLHWKKCYRSNEELFDAAESLVKTYAGASLVVTSRIDSAMACLGLETPVIFTNAVQQSKLITSQSEGLKDMLNILKWDNDHLISEFELEGKISSSNNIPENKMFWKPLAQRLIERCESWI